MTSPARRHRERWAGRQTAESKAAKGVTVTTAAGAGGDIPAGDPVAAQIRMRFQADMQRLHAIKSIRAKIATKRKILPEYEAFCAGMLESGIHGERVADDILATVMVWRIDTGDYAGALTIARHILTYGLAMPARYNRDAATTVTEEISDAALRALGQDESFDLDVLRQTQALTANADMHDEIRAKIFKAIGLELFRRANAAENAADLLKAAADALQQAQGFDDRVGVKKYLSQIGRALRAAEHPAE